MNLLAAPALVSQLDGEPSQYDHCGQAVVTSILLDSGVTTTLAEVERTAQTFGLQDANGETTAQDLVSLLAHYGVAALAQSGLPDSTLATGCEAICLVSSNSDGVPIPGTGIGHWLLCYGNSGGYSFMQPLGPVPGSLILLSSARFSLVQFGLCVALTAPLPKDRLEVGTHTLPSGSQVVLS